MKPQLDYATQFGGFLREARMHARASAASAAAMLAHPGWMSRHFEGDEYIYDHGWYGGSERLFGTETIAPKGETLPVWGLGYYGQVFLPVLEELHIREEALHGFLKGALLEDPQGAVPVRGPKYFYQNAGRLKYMLVLSTASQFDAFSGTEEISQGTERLYIGRVHGGLIR